MLHLQIITFTDEKKSLDLNIEKLRARTRDMFLRTCECNISFN